MVPIDVEITPEEHELLRAMASDEGVDKNTRKRAQAVVTFVDTRDFGKAGSVSGLSKNTVRKIITKYRENGWQGLIIIQPPRGGDFLARYDNGYWAERLARVFLDRSTHSRAIPYGTSHSEPFTDQETFRKYAVSEALLQAWSLRNGGLGSSLELSNTGSNLFNSVFELRLLWHFRLHDAPVPTCGGITLGPEIFSGNTRSQQRFTKDIATFRTSFLLTRYKGVCRGTATPSNRTATDSRDTEGSTIHGAAEFGEALFNEKPRQSIEEPARRRSHYNARL